MKISLLCSFRSSHQVSCVQAISQGLKTVGVKSEIIYRAYSCKNEAVACWGWRAGENFRIQGKEVLVMERGYLGDRFKYTSLGWNGLNGYADFGPIENVTSERFDKVAKLKPWKRQGSSILLLGQVPGDKSLKGKNLTGWYEEIAQKAMNIWGLPVKFRPHPLAYKKGPVRKLNNVEFSTGTLEEAFEEALFSITFNSNSSVDSIINGVPCYVQDKGSMAWDVASKSLSEIVTPEREDWAYKLAHKQWTLDEIAKGLPFKRLFKNG